MRALTAAASKKSQPLFLCQEDWRNNQAHPQRVSE
jgi:hypothetical protein